MFSGDMNESNIVLLTSPPGFERRPGSEVKAAAATGDAASGASSMPSGTGFMHSAASTRQVPTRCAMMHGYRESCPTPNNYSSGTLWARWSIENAVTGNKTRGIIHKRDEPSVLVVQGNHLPITLPEGHGVFPLIANPFPLIPLLHADLHPSRLKQNPIDRIVGNVHPIHVFDLPLKMRRSERVLLLNGKDNCFDLIRDRRGLPPRCLGVDNSRFADTTREAGRCVVGSPDDTLQVPEQASLASTGE